MLRADRDGHAVGVVTLWDWRSEQQMVKTGKLAERLERSHSLRERDIIGDPRATRLQYRGDNNGHGIWSKVMRFGKVDVPFACRGVEDAADAPQERDDR